MPKTWPDLEKRYGYGGFIQLEHCGTGCAKMMRGGKFFREVQPNCWDPAARLAECDSAGVNVQVLSTVPIMFSYWAKPEDAHDLSRILNDHVAGVVRDRPKRFVGLGTLPMQAPDLAIQELERCVGELGLAGVEIGSHVNGRNLDDPAIFSVLKRCAELDAAVFVHPWDMLGEERMAKYWMRWLVGMPCETAIAMCSLLMGGVMEKLPDLRICFAHGGGSFPGTIGRIEHGFQVRPDLCATDSKRSPRSLLHRIYVDSLVHDRAALCFLVDLMGAERIALGTDYPFPLGEAEPGKLIESIEEFSLDDKERLLSGTALEFLGLKRGSF